MATPNGGNKPPRRPVAGSRTPTSRPHKIAGSREESHDIVEDTGDTGAAEDAGAADTAGAAPPPASPDTTWPDEDADPSDGEPPRIRTTIALVVVVLLLVAVASTEGWYLWVRDDGDVVSADRPVVASALETGSAVDTAAKSMQAIVSKSYKNYGGQVDDATSKMTAAFAEEYRQTADDIEDEFVKSKTEVAVEITGQGVVSASPEQVKALVFLTQLVTHDGKGLTATPYRALVTVVNTDQGWLVSDIETR